MALDRIRAQLAVVTCPAPLALRFDAEAAPGGVRIVALAEVPDSDDPAATCRPRFTVTIPEDASRGRVAKAVAEVALLAVANQAFAHGFELEREIVAKGPVEAQELVVAGHLHISGYNILRDPQSGLISHALRVGSYKIHDRYAEEQGLDTVEANLALGLPSENREYGAAVAILRDLGVKTVRLMTNNPAKSSYLNEAGIPVNEYVPVITGLASENLGYLETKREKMGHIIPDEVKAGI